MRIVVPVTLEDDALEHAADALIGRAPRDSERPAYTEKELMRRNRRTIRIETLLEDPAPPPQSLRDEMRFLASVTRLGGDLRRYLGLWLEGWRQTEIAEALRVSQQTVSR